MNTINIQTQEIRFISKDSIVIYPPRVIEISAIVSPSLNLLPSSSSSTHFLITQQSGGELTECLNFVAILKLKTYVPSYFKFETR